MKVGIELKIDVTKIEKSRLYQGQKGKYLTMTAFVDLDNEDQYGNNGMITHKKEQGEDGQTPILGNSKVFWKDNGNSQQSPQQQHQQQQKQNAQNLQQNVNGQAPQGFDDFDSDIPF